MIRDRHPRVANMIVDVLASLVTPTLNGVAQSDFAVRGVQGFEAPSWQVLSHGARPPSCTTRFATASRVEQCFPRPIDEKAMLRSQSGPGAGVALSAVPSCDVLRLAPHLFRVLLLRRLRLPLPLVSHTCRCGRPLDAFGHHRAACCRAGEARECRSQDLPRSWRSGLHQVRACTTHDVWRSSLRVSRCLGELKSRLTLNWSQCTTVTEPPDRAPQPGMAQQWRWLVRGRKPLTQSLWVREAEQSWLCWHWKLAAGGQPRQRHF